MNSKNSRCNYSYILAVLCCGGIAFAQTSTDPAYDLYDGRRTDSQVNQEERKRVSQVLDEARSGDSPQRLREARRKLLAGPNPSVVRDQVVQPDKDKETSPKPKQPQPSQGLVTKVPQEEQRKPFVFPGDGGDGEGGKKESDPTREDL